MAEAEDEGNSEGEDEEMEEAGDQIAELPAKGMGGQNVQAAIPIKPPQPASSSMPLPPGLLPTGGVAGMGGFTESQQKCPAPKSSFAPSGVSKLANQYDPMPWSDFYDTREMIDEKIPLYTAGTQGHLFLCLHGASHSALSFALMASMMKERAIVTAFDFRGHGGHFVENEEELDLSAETLINDTMIVIDYVLKKYPEHSLHLIGHSMGGSIATKVAAIIEANHKDDHVGKALSAVCIIDVVEGSAMDALPFME